MKFAIPIFFLLFFGFTVNSQNKIQDNSIEITYVKAYKNYKDDSSDPPRVMKDLEYNLLCNTNEAIFEYIPRMSNDGSRTNERYVGMGGGGRGIYYKNLREKEKLNAVKSDGEDFIIIDKFDKYNWELYRETKKILGYECFKAVGSYEEYNYALGKNQTITVVAWYTPNIPLPFGPSGFDGLPGLVLESLRGSFYLTASKIQFHKKPRNIKRPTKGLEITDEEYAKSQYNAFLNHVKK